MTGDSFLALVSTNLKTFRQEVPFSMLRKQVIVVCKQISITVVHHEVEFIFQRINRHLLSDTDCVVFWIVGASLLYSVRL